MNKQAFLAPLYQEGKIKLAFGYSLRIAKKYYKTKRPTESQRDMIRKMLNPKRELKCQPMVLRLALQDLQETATQHLDTAKTLRTTNVSVTATVEETEKIMQEVING